MKRRRDGTAYEGSAEDEDAPNRMTRVCEPDGAVQMKEGNGGCLPMHDQILLLHYLYKPSQ